MGSAALTSTSSIARMADRISRISGSAALSRSGVIGYPPTSRRTASHAVSSASEFESGFAIIFNLRISASRPNDAVAFDCTRLVFVLGRPAKPRIAAAPNCQNHEKGSPPGEFFEEVAATRLEHQVETGGQELQDQDSENHANDSAGSPRGRNAAQDRDQNREKNIGGTVIHVG